MCRGLESGDWQSRGQPAPATVDEAVACFESDMKQRLDNLRACFDFWRGDVESSYTRTWANDRDSERTLVTHKTENR
jgi:hypothetical protein